MLASSVSHTALSTAFAVNNAPRGPVMCLGGGRHCARSAFLAKVQHHPAADHNLRTMTSMTMNLESNPEGVGVGPLTAVLVRGAGNAAGDARVKDIASTLSSRGFEVQTLVDDGDAQGALNTVDGLFGAMAKLNLTVPRSVVVFDLGGRGGRELALACEGAGLGGLYAFKAATGMFQKVRW